jgi:hypothetical protein
MTSSRKLEEENCTADLGSRNQTVATLAFPHPQEAKGKLGKLNP